MWSNETPEEYYHYHTSIYHQNQSYDISKSQNPQNNSKCSPADMFLKVIKKDINAYIEFKHYHDFYEWKRNFLSIIHSQGIEDILDTNNTPMISEEI